MQFDQIGTPIGDGDYFFFNFAAFTPALPPGDRQVYYGSFTRDICDKYLTVFGDFKSRARIFDLSLAAVPFTPDPFKVPGTDVGLASDRHQRADRESVESVHCRKRDHSKLLPRWRRSPVYTGVRFRGINDTGPRHEKFTYNDYLFDVGLRGETGICWRLLQDLELGSWFSLLAQRRSGHIRRRG